MTSGKPFQISNWGLAAEMSVGREVALRDDNVDVTAVTETGVLAWMASEGVSRFGLGDRSSKDAGSKDGSKSEDFGEVHGEGLVLNED
ncbi:hypothetical protein H2199_007663 [Coniosporium tulheliwenetii]|uniref:Uncharacterized protein n=1 Tax=Coniosporium tulheliwenetii TaxID=3383036 RepID=A0ACC2YMZ8_9PEZI|nr:hypothetical protein H2199_007663 [Cladosporium sp. JES 115]